MKSIYTLITFLLCTFALHAADTTLVKSHNKVVIKTDPSRGFTEYPAKVGFPHDSEQYRKVYMYLEFGCAPGLRCGEWDYGNHVYLFKDSVRYEIARFITPYGFYWNSGQNWKHGWYYDLTDFAYLLHDSCDIIYQHSGYEGNTDRGWTVTMDFYMVHGEPAREPKGLSILHRVNAPYGNVNNPFSNVVKPKTFTMPAAPTPLTSRLFRPDMVWISRKTVLNSVRKKEPLRWTAIPYQSKMCGATIAAPIRFIRRPAPGYTTVQAGVPALRLFRQMFTGK